MRNVDFKADAGFLALPSGSVVRGNGELSGLFRELNNEVSRFIESGSAGNSARATPAPAASAPSASLSPEGAWNQVQAAEGAPSATQQAFLREIGPLAEAAGQRLGVSADVLAAHAALESGWGQRPIRRADGSSAHNLFGLKAGASWQGDTTEVATTEYEQGQPLTKRQDFRSYAGPAQSFNDLTQLLLNNPRYQGALQAGGNALAYGQALQKGGYATDPAYADKLARVAARIKGAL